MEDHSFTFNVESVHLFLSISRSKHLCELCIDSYILAYCTYYITLCWQYPWDIDVTSWKQPLKLNLLYVASIPLLWIIALWVNSYARLIDACLESTIHEKSLLYDSVVYSCHYHCFDRCIHYICLQYDQVYDGMSLQKLSLLSFTCSGRAETKLGDADTSPTYR